MKDKRNLERQLENGFSFEDVISFRETEDFDQVPEEVDKEDPESQSWTEEEEVEDSLNLFFYFQQKLKEKLFTFME